MSFIKKIFRYTTLIIVFIFLLGSTAFNSKIEIFSSNLIFNSDEEYKLCKRPLEILEFAGDLTNIIKGEKVFLSLQHLHFFGNNNKIDKELLGLLIHSVDYNYVNTECKNNYYSNFGFTSTVGFSLNSGFSIDSNISCNEKIEDYKYCSKIKLDRRYLIQALDWLLGDFMYHKYNLFAYNCQAFAYELLDTYRVVKTEIKELPLNNDYILSPKCIDSHSYNVSQTNFIFRLKSAVFDKQKTPLLFINNDINSLWEINPLYKYN